MKSEPTLIILLGYAGLIPFVLPAGMLMFGASYSAELTQIANVYALAIICFLCGSWWGLALPLSKSLTLVLSNAYFLVALFCFIFAPRWWSLIAAILLMGLLLVEQKSVFFPALSSQYRNLRLTLTLVASISMALTHLAR